MRRRWASVGLVVVATVFLVWTVAIPGIMQWQLEAALRRSFPAESIRVGVRGRPDQILNGRISWLTLDIREAVVDGLRLAELTAQVAQLELDSPRLFNGGPLVIRKVGPGRASVTITEEGLRRYLEARGLKNSKVRLSDGHLMLEGMIPVLQTDFRATMQGRFVLVEERQVVFQVESFTVSGLTMSPEIANVLIAPLNPLLRADQLPIPLRLRQLVVDKGRLTLMAEPSP